MTILVATIGRGKDGQDHCYEKTRYRFPDNHIHTASFFGLALYRWLELKGKKPEKLLVLGTATSSWKALLEEFDPEHTTLANELNNATNGSGIDNRLLDCLSITLSKNLNISTVCRVIPKGENDTEHYQIVSAIWNEVSPNDDLWMDLTHGYRHMPMLELFSALNIEEGKRVKIKGLYYGMLEDGTGTGKAVELAVAKELSQWTRAMHSLKTGNSESLIGLPGMEAFSQDLQHLVLYEEFNRIDRAKKYAQNILSRLQTEGPSTQSGKLYKKELIDHFQWAKEDVYYFRQFSKAKNSIRCRDYLHGIILLMEAWITKMVPCGKNPMDYGNRKVVGNSLNHDDDWKFLNELRNSIAHGLPPDGKFIARIENLMNDPEAMHKELLQLLEVVENKLTNGNVSN